MKNDSVCLGCRYCVSILVTKDLWAGDQYDDECKQCSEQFMMPEGCYCYDERTEYND